MSGWSGWSSVMPSSLYLVYRWHRQLAIYESYYFAPETSVAVYFFTSPLSDSFV